MTACTTVSCTPLKMPSTFSFAILLSGLVLLCAGCAWWTLFGATAVRVGWPPSGSRGNATLAPDSPSDGKREARECPESKDAGSVLANPSIPSNMPSTGFNRLPPEVLRAIAEQALLSDIELRAQAKRARDVTSSQGIDNEDTACLSEVSGHETCCSADDNATGIATIAPDYPRRPAFALGRCSSASVVTCSTLAQSKRRIRGYSSALCLALSDKTLRNAALPIIWRVRAKEHLLGSYLQPTHSNNELQAIDFEAIPRGYHAQIVDLLAQGHGRHVRTASILIALQDCVSTSSSTRALTVPTAIRVLEAIPNLGSLEVTFLSSTLPPFYVSQLPSALSTAIGRHGMYLGHFGISARDAPASPPANGPPAYPVSFQLDEGLVARLLPHFSRLRSLTLHRVGCDTLSTTSPLLVAIRSLTRLRKLDLLDVQALSDAWASGDYSLRIPELQDLSIVCCPRLSFEALDSILLEHYATLHTLSLYDLQHISGSSSRSSSDVALYNLPNLHSLSLEARYDAIDYIKRFSSVSVPLKSLNILHTSGITADDLCSFLRTRSLKHLQTLTIEERALSESTRRSDIARLRKAAADVSINFVCDENCSPTHRESETRLPVVMA